MMTTKPITHVAGILEAALPPAASTKNQGSTNQAGFDATLQAASSNQSAQPLQTPGSDHLPQSSQSLPAGDASKTQEAPTPATGQTSQHFAGNFSFFLRITGDLGDWGKPLQSQFCEASKAVAETFLGRDGWQGDPVAMFLNGTTKAMLGGEDSTSKYLGSIRQTAGDGIDSLAAILMSHGGFSGAAAGSGFGSSGSGFGWAGLSQTTGQTIDPLLNNSGTFDLARLRVSALTQTSGLAPTRPMPRNRSGVPLVMIAATQLASSTLGTSNAGAGTGNGTGAGITTGNSSLSTVNGTTSPDSATRFLEKFLDMVKEFLKDLSSPNGPAKPPSSEQPQGETASTSPGSDTSPNPPETPGAVPPGSQA